MQALTTEAEMVDVIAAGPATLFNALLEAVKICAPVQPLFVAAGYDLPKAIATQLHGSSFKEKFYARPQPAHHNLRKDRSVKLRQPAAQADVLFVQLSRRPTGQTFYAAVRGADGIILPARFNWQARTGQMLEKPRDVVMNIAMLRKSGKSSFTTVLGQLRQR